MAVCITAYGIYLRYLHCCITLTILG